jgi:GTPase SAR1 family protein
LDPAVSSIPFGANIDIRETVNYKEVMKQYNLGPNGGILTALNLFTTKFDQVLGYIDRKADHLDYVLVDTPGQIEIFTWSASGQIITDSLAATYPTVLCYIIDTPRSTAPATFMSNMLYACSILYKTKLPFLIVFNKTDIVDHEFAVEWMQDFESLQQAVMEDTSYMASMVQSMCLVLEEFYQHLKVVGVSAVTGEGMNDFMDAVAECAKEYTRYRVSLDSCLVTICLKLKE